MSSEEQNSTVDAGRYLARCVHPCALIMNILHIANELSLEDEPEEEYL